jgi:hypothetical protein
LREPRGGAASVAFSSHDPLLSLVLPRAQRVVSQETMPFDGSIVRFYTRSECEDWLSARQRQKPDAAPDAKRERIAYPPTLGRVRFLSHWMARSLTYQRPALLWISESGIWPSSENWHVYYKLLQSYGDQRLLDEAPGHLFLKHESEDLASFLQLAILNGWGGYLLTEADYVNVFFSHDEYFDFFSEEDRILTDLREVFRENKPAAE